MVLISVLILGFFLIRDWKREHFENTQNVPVLKFNSQPKFAGETLYQEMSDEKNAGHISFSGKEYQGLGFFVTDIGSLHEGNGKYLFYYVNGVEASAGVSTFVPKVGDLIEWKLK